MIDPTQAFQHPRQLTSSTLGKNTTYILLETTDSPVIATSSMTGIAGYGRIDPDWRPQCTVENF